MTEERRRRALTDEDVQAIAEAVGGLPQETHREHHEFIALMVGREQRRVQMVEKVKGHVIGWGIVTSIGGLGYAVWDWVRNNVR